MGVCMIMPRAAILTAWLRPGTGLAPGHDVIAPATAWLTSALAREAEQRTGFLWLVVAYGLGILTWFTATADPAWWWAPGLAVPVAILACRLEGWQRWLALAGLFFLMGIASAGWRLAVTGTPMLARPIHALVSGHVEAVDHTPSRSRLLIRVIGIEGLAPEVTPVRVKLAWPGISPCPPALPFASRPASPRRRAGLAGRVRFSARCLFPADRWDRLCGRCAADLARRSGSPAAVKAAGRAG